MHKLIAACAFVALAFTYQPTAAMRTDAAPAVDPVLLNAAHRKASTPTQHFFAEVQRAYQLVAYMDRLRSEHDAATLTALAAQAQQGAAQSHERGRQRENASMQAPSSGHCGGELPPCYIMERESGGSLGAENPGSSASGKWQFLDSTWKNYGGYAHASDAPESVQDSRARELWNGGAGCSNWSAC
jgi:hypothetical protein